MSKSLEAYYITFHVHRAVKKGINTLRIYPLDLFNTRYFEKDYRYFRLMLLIPCSFPVA